MTTGNRRRPGLDRHVLPVRRGLSWSGGSVGSEVVLDRDGFLELSPEGGFWFPGGVRPISVMDLVGADYSFVLLAPGGVGKTTVLEELRRLESAAVAVDLRLYDKSGMHQTLGAAIEDGGPVYLDGLDVIAGEEPSVFRIIEHHMTTPAGRQVRWRLACRPAAWVVSLAAALDGSLPGFQELRLLALSRAAAASLAARAGVPDGFLDAVVDANLGRLAASAMRFAAAAEQWRATRRLPTSHLAAVEYEVTQFLTETGAGVPSSLPLDRRRRIAMRLAAVSVFGHINRFARTVEPASPGRQPVDGLPSTPEPDEPGTPIAPAEVNEVLGTALFDIAPDAALAFRHQQYAEYLVARYVVDRQITHAQLHTLLGVRDDGCVPGVLAGVTAWLAAIDSALVEDLIAANAVALTQTGVELPSDDIRAALVRALLATAAERDTDPDWSLDLTGLAYPRLAEDLRRHITSGLAHDEQLWWIGRLAEAGRCDSLGEDILKEVLNPAWSPWARRPCAAAIVSFADDSMIRRLRPLLSLEPDEDPDDELLAAGIEALYPRLMTTPELLDVLRPRRNTNLIGAYLVLLGQLSDQITVDDLPIVLRWAAERVGDGEEAYGRLIPQLIQVGWSQAMSPPVRAGLAGLVAALITATGRHSWRDRGERPWTEADGDLRGQLAVLVAEHLDDHHWYDLLQLALVTADDLGFLLTELPHLPPRAQRSLAGCLPALVSQPTARDADLILSLSDNHPAYEATRDLREPTALDSPQAQRSRQANTREHNAEVERTRRRDLQRQRLTESLHATTDSLGNWWKIVYWLSCDGSSRPDHGFRHDLTTRTGWDLLDPDEQQHVFDLGLRYLRTHEPSLAARDGVGQITFTQVMPDWSGVYLLATLARHQPGLVRSLDVPVWRKWAPAIVSAWSSGSDDDGQLRGDVIDLAPAEARGSLVAAALERLDAYQAHSHALTVHCVYEHLMADLAPTVGQRLVAGAYTGDLAATLLDLLISRAPDIARSTCHQLRADKHPTLAQLAHRGQATLDPDSVVAELVTHGATPDTLDTMAPALDLTRLTDHSLTTFGRLLLDQFPIAEDPHWTSSDYSPFSVRRTRDRILEQLAGRGLSEALTNLRDDRPEVDRYVISAHLRRCRAQEANLAFTPLEPRDLLALLGRADARLVRTNDDLLRVVIENLRELQHQIKHGNAWRDLWNLGDHPTPQSEDDISDWVQRNLTTLLTNGSVVDRELQVRRPGRGIGTRIDITATATTATQPPTHARVIIEAKLINHPQLFNAMHTQLVQRYLNPTGVRHGIYLVYWIAPHQRPANWTPQDRRDADAVQAQLDRQAASADNDITIRPFLLDISRPM